jgi:hypothetical protein
MIPLNVETITPVQLSASSTALPSTPRASVSSIGSGRKKSWTLALSCISRACIVHLLKTRAVQDRRALSVEHNSVYTRFSTSGVDLTRDGRAVVKPMRNQANRSNEKRAASLRSMQREDAYSAVRVVSSPRAPTRLITSRLEGYDVTRFL